MISKTIAAARFCMMAVFTIAAISISTAHASTTSECDSIYPGERHECLAAKAVIAEAKMTTLYEAHRKALAIQMASTNKGDQQRARVRDSQLVAAQEAWTKLRDAECALEASEFAGGPYEGLMFNDCRLTKTGERIRQLEQLKF